MSETKIKPGPPVKYKEDYPWMAKVACEEGGFTDLGLATLFDVCKATINRWKRKYPEFKQAIKEGKNIFDTTIVEAALLKRALGYNYNETTKELDPKTKKMVNTKRVRKHVSGDVKAQTFWLRNRSRKRWPDTHKLEGGLDVNPTHEEMLDRLK